MDAMEYSNDFKPTDLRGHEIQSSHLQLDSIPSNSQPNDAVESIPSSRLQLDSIPSNSHSNEGVESIQSSHGQLNSIPSNSKSIEYAQFVNKHTSNSGQCNCDNEVAYIEYSQAVDNDNSNAEQFNFHPEVAHAESAQVGYYNTSNTRQYNFGPQVAYAENALVVDNLTSNSGESSYDYRVAYAPNAQAMDNCNSNSGQCSDGTQTANAVPLSSDSNNSFTYNGVTYYSYKAFEQDIQRQFIQDRRREMQIDGAVPNCDDVDGPRFSDCMVLATGGSPAIINPYNGLPWRKDANLCRPYIDEGYCQFGTACVFHHPWPPSNDLP